MDGQDAQDKTEDSPVLHPVHPAYPCQKGLLFVIFVPSWFFGFSSFE
jgi:hypothetical protein